LVNRFLKKSSVCILFLLLLASSCTERKGSPVGIELIDEKEMGEGPIEVIVYADRDTSFDEQLNGGASPQLLVGSEGETILRSLLRFETLPEADSILRATVKLRKSSGYSISSFDVVAYTLTEDWDEIQVTWETALNDSSGEPVPWIRSGGDFDPVEVGSFFFSDDDEDTLFEMSLDTELVEAWIDGSVQNNGIILVSSMEGSDFILASLISRQSTDGIGEPTIEVEYITEDNPDSTLLAEFLVTNDAFIYDFQGSANPSTLILGDIPNFGTMLSFDLSEFDSTWTIIRADLNIHFSDTTHYHDELVAEAMAVLDTTWNGSDTEIDNAILGSVTISPGDSAFELNLTGIIQLWVTGEFENYGVIIKMGRTTNVFGYLEMYGVGTPEQDNRPSLRLFYHKPGEPPFDQEGAEEKKISRSMK
jgi:hypothetical protein